MKFGLKGVVWVAIVMLLLGMVSTIVIVVFALQNGRIVTVGFFDWSIEASLVLVIIVSALMGFLAALFFELFIQIKLRYRLFKMGRQIRDLEEEVQHLRRGNPAAVPSPEKPLMGEGISKVEPGQIVRDGEGNPL